MINFFLDLKQRIRNISQYIRFTPFDTTTVDGINKERYRKATLATLTSFCGKFISILTALYSVPLTLNYLGPNSYGILMLITSINVILIFSDLGLGNGLVNSVSKYSALSNRSGIKLSISSVFFILCIITLCLSLIYLFSASHISWYKLLNIKKTEFIPDIEYSIHLFIACFLLNVPLSVVYKVQIGYQEMFLANIWQSIGNLFGFISLVLFIRYRLTLPYIVFALNGIPLLFTLFNFITEFYFRRPINRPELKYFKASFSIQILNAGLIFTFINLANVVGSSFDNFILARELGPSNIVNFTIVSKLFSILYVITYFSAPFWPAFSEAILKNDFKWARSAFRKIMNVTVGVTFIVCLLISIFYAPVIEEWVGGEVKIKFNLIIGFSFFWIFSALAQASVNLMQSERYLKTLLLFTCLYSFFSFILKIIFVKHFGDFGVIIAGAICYGFFFSIPITVYSLRILKSNSSIKSC